MSAAARAWLPGRRLCARSSSPLDQVAKAVVEAHLVIGEEVDVLGPLGLTLSHNRGVAFGLAGGGGAPLVAGHPGGARLSSSTSSPAIPTRPGMWVATGLLAGGAIGNLADRVRAGAVTDFIDLPPWPPFNLADVAITAGVLAAGLDLPARSRAGSREGG